jgi:hypothetical protein
MLVAGCAHRPETMAELIAARPGRRAELAKLSERVDVLRARLGLPAPEAPPLPPPPPLQPPPQPQVTAAPPPPAMEEPPPTVREAPPSRRPEILEPTTTVTAQSLRGSTAGGRHRQSSHCRDVKAVAGEICHAADRICVLADQLADDDARWRCTQARLDCRRARYLGDDCD